MFSRAFSHALAKGTRRPLDAFVQAPTALRSGCQMHQQLRHLHCRPDVRAVGLQRPLGKGSVRPACIFQPNWTVQRSFSTVENSVDDASTRELGAAGVCYPDQRFASLMSIGDCVNQNELKQLLEKKAAPVCYVWCDPSPCMHITQGISVTVNVNKMIKAGCKVKILMADWLARLDPENTDGRFGGHLTEMKELGSYNLEVWKAAGMDLDGVEPVWLSNGISRNENVYWPLTMDIARTSELGGIKRFLRFHASKHTKGYGRIDRYALRDFNAAEILSPCLQSAGMLLEHAIGRKMRKAFCPPGSVEGNPCLEYIQHIILPRFGKFEVVRGDEDGGNKTFVSMEEFADDYRSGALHPPDVKQALERALNIMLQPVRDHFRNKAQAKKQDRVRCKGGATSDSN
ncbi:tyrosine--tRNA ligase 1, cytoplasmic-like [Lolium rigidum]|uniref:tyrosine--tRNA ligase 1, cytoplasmic-like n=1 Tax=Lolium rigidum TaxID=89674 RepID=UPI001F5D8459|nr:tyrosine--tRNA ligase 1, cytoplasmic-like [Lolium rigidum]